MAVKATFEVWERTRIRLADVQAPPLLAPEHRGKPGTSSLRFDADLGAMKPNTDVIVDGFAQAPDGKPVSEIAVGLRFPSVQKNLVVRGESVFHGTLGTWSNTRPLPFTKMPVTYERAFGGADFDDPDPKRQAMDRRNPVGCGVVAQPSKLLGKPAPNVIYPGRDLAKAGPAGFGPVESYWSPRLELGGTYDQAWEANQKPFLPLDWSPLSTLGAPADQRPPVHLRGGDPIEVVHMSPGGVFAFTLPRIYLAFTTYFGSRAEEHRSKLVTVIVMPEEARFAMVWQTTLTVPLRHMDYLDKTVIREKPYIA